MQLLKLVLCVSLILTNIGCASQRESLLSHPTPLAETTPATETTESPPAKTSESRPHPIRDTVKDAARGVGNLISGALILPVILLTGAVGALPKC